MDVRLPDGRIVRNVPQGTTKADLAAKLAKAGIDVAAPAPEMPKAREPLGKAIGNYARGIQQGFYDIPQGAITLATRATDALGVTDNITPGIQKIFEDSKQGDPGSTTYQVGRVGGQLAATAPLTAVKVAQGVKLGAQMVNTGLQGTTASLLTSAESDSPITDAGVSGAVASAIPVVGRVASRVVSPVTRKAVQILKKEGIPLTTGQMAGNAAQRAEDKLMSVPITGDRIIARRVEGIERLNRAVLNRALKPIKAALPDNVPVGREAVDHVATTLGQGYDNLLPNLTGKVDRRLVVDLARIYNTATRTMPSAQVDRLRETVGAQLRQRGPSQILDGRMLKGIESELTTIANGLKSDPSFDNRQLGQAFEDVLTATRNMIQRHNPRYAPQLKALNEGWHNYRIAARAAASQGAENGVFTPAQLSAAVKATDRSIGKTRFARGKASMQDLSDAAKEVMSSKVPNSGTVDRALLTAGAGFMANPAIPATLGAGAAAYSRPGQAAINALAFSRPAGANALARGIDRNARLLAPATGLVRLPSE